MPYQTRQYDSKTWTLQPVFWHCFIWVTDQQLTGLSFFSACFPEIRWKHVTSHHAWMVCLCGALRFTMSALYQSASARQQHYLCFTVSTTLSHRKNTKFSCTCSACQDYSFLWTLALKKPPPLHPASALRLQLKTMMNHNWLKWSFMGEHIRCLHITSALIRAGVVRQMEPI